MAKKVAPFRELDDGELLERLAEAKVELFNLRFQNATGQLERTARIGELRKDVARLNTLRREREIAAAESLSHMAPPRTSMENADG